MDDQAADNAVTSVDSGLLQMVSGESLENFMGDMADKALSAVFVLAVWFYLLNVFSVASARIFLEGRVYKEVSVSRILFLVRLKKRSNAALVMLLKTVYQSLWMLTIVGRYHQELFLPDGALYRGGEPFRKASRSHYPVQKADERP